jgi:hypothetical protein
VKSKDENAHIETEYSLHLFNKEAALDLFLKVKEIKIFYNYHEYVKYEI